MSVTGAPTVEKAAVKNVPSDILGPLTVPEEEVFRFPSGLFGLPDCRSFVMVSAEREGLYWLQSVEHAALTFLLADPFLYFPDYSVDLTDSQMRELEATEPAHAAVLVIITLPRARGEEATANLQGPLVLNPTARIGRQLALQDSPFDLRAPIDLLGPPRS